MAGDCDAPSRSDPGASGSGTSGTFLLGGVFCVPLIFRVPEHPEHLWVPAAVACSAYSGTSELSGTGNIDSDLRCSACSGCSRRVLRPHISPDRDPLPQFAKSCVATGSSSCAALAARLPRRGSAPSIWRSASTGSSTTPRAAQIAESIGCYSVGGKGGTIRVVARFGTRRLTQKCRDLAVLHVMSDGIVRHFYDRLKRSF